MPSGVARNFVWGGAKCYTVKKVICILHVTYRYIYIYIDTCTNIYTHETYKPYIYIAPDLVFMKKQSIRLQHKMNIMAKNYMFYE